MSKLGIIGCVALALVGSAADGRSETSDVLRYQAWMSCFLASRTDCGPVPALPTAQPPPTPLPAARPPSGPVSRPPALLILNPEELHALRAKVTACWHGDGAPIAVRVTITGDGRVIEANPLDPAAAGRDHPGRRSLDAVRAALRDPQCQPLPVPSGPTNSRWVFTATLGPPLAVSAAIANLPAADLTASARPKSAEEMYQDYVAMTHIDPYKALDIVKKITELYPNNSLYNFLLARDYYSLGQYSSAADLFLKLSEGSSDDMFTRVSLTSLGDALVQLNRVAQACAVFDSYDSRFPEDRKQGRSGRNDAARQRAGCP